MMAGERGSILQLRFSKDFQGFSRIFSRTSLFSGSRRVYRVCYDLGIGLAA